MTGCLRDEKGVPTSPRGFACTVLTTKTNLRHAALSTWPNSGVDSPRWPSAPATASKYY
jgi:hypothetical protein